MFERKNEKFWNEKEINYGLLTTERWKTIGKTQLKTHLEDLTIDDLKQIHRSLQLSKPIFDEKTSYIEAILASENAVHLFLLDEFHRKFRKSIIDYLKKRKLGGSEEGRSFFLLFSLFTDSTEDHLLNIFIYHNWNASSTVTIFKPATNANQFPTDITVQFQNGASGFAKKLSSKNWYIGRKKVRFIGSFDSIFIFDKQTGDKLVQTTSGHKRLKPSRYALIKIQPANVEIREVRGGRSKYIGDSIKKILENQFSTELIDESQNPSIGNLETFLGRFKNSSSNDEFEIISLKTKRSKLDKGIPIEIDNFSFGNDISIAIIELIDKDVISLDNLSDFDNFAVSYSISGENGKRKRIFIKEFEDGILKLILNDKELKDVDRQEFSRTFLERFGIGVNIPLDPTNLAPNKQSVYSYLLSEKRVNNPKSFQSVSIETLKHIGILTVVKEFRLRCLNRNCGHAAFSQNEFQPCRDCEAETNKMYDSYKLEISERGTQNYILNLFYRSSKFSIRRQRKIQIKNTKFTLIETQIDNKPVFIYLNFKRLSKMSLEYLVRSGLPILFINIARVVNTSEMQEKLFEQIELSEILVYEDISLPKIERKIEKLQSYSTDRIFNAARSSYNNITEKISRPSEYTPKEFETDVFNIFKQIFPSAYRGGGTYIPEGFVGLEYKTRLNHKRVFEWDCKLAIAGMYDLDRGEIDKAWRYIRGTLASDELKNFNKRVDHYLIISNSVDPTNFKNFARSLNRKRIWSGEKSVVLFPTEALIELHQLYARHQQEILRRPNQFYEEFFKMLLKVDGDKGYCDIQKNNISDLFQKVISLDPEFEELKGEGVAKHLRRDED
jgi:hypothetical protein